MLRFKQFINEVLNQAQRDKVNTWLPDKESGMIYSPKDEITESVSDDPLKWKYKNDDVNTIKKTGKNLGSFNHSFRTYTMFKDPSPSYNKDGYGFIHVIDDEDNVVGDIFWGRREEDGKQEAAVEVHPKHRRRKIATHLYNKVEELTGEKLHPALDHTKDAAAFWANRINSSK